MVATLRAPVNSALAGLWAVLFFFSRGAARALLTRALGGRAGGLSCCIGVCATCGRCRPHAEPAAAWGAVFFSRSQARLALTPGPQKSEKKDDTINTRLALVVKSGKFKVGYRQTLDTIRRGRAKLVVIAKNCPPLRKSEIEYYAMLAQTAVHHFHGNNTELGTACGKVFRASTMSVIDAGDSDILTSLK